MPYKEKYNLIDSIEDPVEKQKVINETFGNVGTMGLFDGGEIANEGLKMYEQSVVKGEELAANYCGHLSGDCASVVFTTECQPTSITDPTQTNYAKWTCGGGGQNCTQCTAEFMSNNPGVQCPYTSCTHCEAQSYYDTSSMCYCNNTGHHRYNCGPLGDCIIDNNGPYMSLGECEDRCSWFIDNSGSNNSGPSSLRNTIRGNYANPMLRNTNISGGY